MKYEITNEQIKEVFERPELLKILFPDAFLETGKWYLRTFMGDTGLFNFSGRYDGNNNPLGYGVNIHGDWKDLDDNGWLYDEIRLATAEEVETALINEAKKRGFEDGVKFKSLDGYDYHTIGEMDNWCDTEENFLRVESIKSEWFNYGGMGCSNPAIFLNGKWAEIIEETEIELTLDEIAEKFRVDRVKIKK